jgi:hypothetical protein
MPLTQIIRDEGESNPYFQQIRAEGVKREPALIIQTLKLLAEKTITVKDGNAFDHNGKLLAGYCINREIDAWLAQEEKCQ